MSGHSIAVITDSTCDIPSSYLEQYQIYVAPQYVIWGTESYRDMVDMSPEEFYTRLTQDSVHPTSSQPVVKDFLHCLEQAGEAGAQEAVIITISNQLSGTVKSAQQAVDLVEMPVHVVDSFSVSMGLGWQVLAAARVREAGGSVQDMIDAAARVRQTVQVIFSVDTLDYLHRGGRIGGAARLVGMALQLKPQLYVDHSTGRVEPGERTRTRRKALERVFQVFCGQMDLQKSVRVAVVHCAAEQEALAMRERIEQEMHPDELVVTHVTPVIGTHAGPGAIGLIGYYED
jgi:DegV family protein with EDD domain